MRFCFVGQADFDSDLVVEFLARLNDDFYFVLSCMYIHSLCIIPMGPFCFQSDSWYKPGVNS